MPRQAPPPEWWLAGTRQLEDGRTIFRFAFRDRPPAEIIRPGFDYSDQDVADLAALLLSPPPPPRRTDT